MSREEIHERRVRLRKELDGVLDFTTDGNDIRFIQRFVSVRFDGPYVDVADEIIESAKRMLVSPITQTVASMMRDFVSFKIGSNVIPLFALHRGGNDRSLYSFHCVYSNCPAFVDVRVFAGVDKIKWIVMGISHSHDLASFPARIPRSTIPDELKDKLQQMVLDRRSCAYIKISNNVLCPNDIYQNAVRKARCLIKTDQARTLRDVVAESKLWESEIHLTDGNVFTEAFFLQTRSCLQITFTLTLYTLTTLHARMDFPFLFLCCSFVDRHRTHIQSHGESLKTGRLIRSNDSLRLYPNTAED